jgi:FkbM family methyltransferase
MPKTWQDALVRIVHSVEVHLDWLRFARLVDVEDRSGLVEIGGYAIPDDLVTPEWICYSGGVGEDLDFELGLVERYGCRVHAFDPTPRAVAYAETAVAPDGRLTFHPYGLWSSDEMRTFYGPEHPAYVSNSAVNLYHQPEAFSASCRSLESLMEEFGHDRVDLLKLDIEGSEYDVLEPVMRGELQIPVLCMELHKVDSVRHMAETVWRLESAGYTAVHLRETVVTLVFETLVSQ